MATITINKKCPHCGDTKQFILDLERYHQWQMGVYIQDAFPELDENDRERLISGICPACWITLFGTAEEDEAE